MNDRVNQDVVIDCVDVCKSYDDGHLRVDVLAHLNLRVCRGQSVSIVGASGSGKSTLLHLLGGLDKPTSGSLKLMGQDLAGLSQAQVGHLRNQYLGFVYQFHHLLPEFTALENVMMPLLIGKRPKAEAEAAAAVMLDKVGLKQRMQHRPSELSGGERQRAAIARALVNNPSCVLADEPTGNLDRKNAANVLDLMLDLKTELNTSLVVVTHDEDLAERFESVLTVDEGGLKTFQAA
ncbi:lipoprotein-releasing ABC transporter ATP-binding protein LolD [Snodgrassella sp. CFCC 13594]|uniref:lipoprotein-releasing ABC transporter ATP-binding protein LolD n=1 Tax=Snodgrassella sp. CFCC 13594 TaxID=1775559 RepID=UPI000835B755|nr:lipoprotein-releasing ABC transporter ATP-binding protein LolD [Snodgrassella sp. CFCC 13594]